MKKPDKLLQAAKNITWRLSKANLIDSSVSPPNLHKKYKPNPPAIDKNEILSLFEKLKGKSTSRAYINSANNSKGSTYSIDHDLESNPFGKILKSSIRMERTLSTGIYSRSRPLVPRALLIPLGIVGDYEDQRWLMPLSKGCKTGRQVSYIYRKQIYIDNFKTIWKKGLKTYLPFDLIKQSGNIISKKVVNDIKYPEDESEAINRMIEAELKECILDVEGIKNTGKLKFDFWDNSANKIRRKNSVMLILRSNSNLKDHNTEKTDSWLADLLKLEKANITEEGTNQDFRVPIIDVPRLVNATTLKRIQNLFSYESESNDNEGVIVFLTNSATQELVFELVKLAFYKEHNI